MVVAIMYPSSAEFWLNAAKGVNFSTFSLGKRKFSELPEDLGNHPRMKEVQMVADGCSLSMPLHVMASSAGYHNSCKGAKFHVKPKKIPPHSFIYLGKIAGTDPTVKGDYSKNREDILIYVSSPEYTFLQAAAQLIKPKALLPVESSDPHFLPMSELVNLIVLGTELCGMYVHDSKEKFCHRRRLPVSSREEILAYLADAGGCSGANIARRAAGHVLDNSNSPMETRISILLTMPPSAGGFGMPFPELNVEIKLDEYSISCDLGWRKEKVGAEYDSDEAHMDSKQHSIDSERQNALSRAGWCIVRVTAGIMRDSRKREETFMNLRQYLGLGNKCRLDKYKERRDVLWKILSRTPVYDLFIRK